MSVALTHGIRYELGGLEFLLDNVRATQGMSAISPLHVDALVLRGARPADIRKLRDVHRNLRDGRDLNVWRRTLFRLRGDRLVVIAEEDEVVAGFNMFYFRADERAQGVVHEAFSGVVETHRGHGIATAMRRYAAACFASQGVNSISSQVRADNPASLRSALNAGFEVVDHKALGCEPETGLLVLRMDLRQAK